VVDLGHDAQRAQGNERRGVRVCDRDRARILAVDDAVQTYGVVDVRIAFQNFAREVDAHDLLRPERGERRAVVVDEHLVRPDGDAQMAGVGDAQALPVEQTRRTADVELDGFVVSHFYSLYTFQSPPVTSMSCMWRLNHSHG